MRRYSAAMLLAGLAAVGLVVAGSASAASPRADVAGSKPAWATAAHKTAGVSSSTTVQFTVYLKLRNAAAAAATARAVSTPGNAAYGHYLTNSAFNARFSPAGATIRSLTAWLRSQSLKVTGVAANHLWVKGSGSAAAVGKAFGTSFAVYRVNGHNRRSITDPVSLPSGLAGHVAEVGGLSQIAMKPRDVPSPGFRIAPPCSKYQGQKIGWNVPKVYGAHRPWAVCGYTPNQLRGAYGVTRSGLSGKGSTVAITDAYDSPTLPADANTYSKRHGLPVFAGGQYRDISDPALKNKTQDQTNCGDWYGEQTLDVEAVHAIAPKANIVYSGGESCFDNDLLNALHAVVDGHKAQIVTNSWGDVELDSTPASTLAYHQLLLEAACKGISMLFSTGDDGDFADLVGQVTTSTPSDDPLATAVGGTAIGINRQNHFSWQTGWGDYRSVLTDGAWDPAVPGAFWSGSGGGASVIFKQPWYQKGIVPSALARSGVPGVATRVQPDISMDAAAPTGMLVGQTQTWLNGTVHYGEYRIGGTSLASPLMAGMLALANQARHHAVGFANPLLYRLHETSAILDVRAPARPIVLLRNDYVNQQNAADGITTSTRVYTGADSTLKTTRGYDDVTGIGTPGRNFFWWMAR